MLISVEELVHNWGVSPTGIVHVGAHEAEERDSYVNSGWKSPFFWIEAQSDKADLLRKKLPDSDIVIHGAAWSIGGLSLSLKVTGNSQSSSLLDLGEHKVVYPDISVVREENVQTLRIDEVIPLNTSVEFLAVDIQGAELEALKGASKLLKDLKWIYLEVNKRPVYLGCSLVEEIDQFLESHSFKRVQTRWVTGAGWGDALYIKRSEIPPFLQTKPVKRLIVYLREIFLSLRRPWNFLPLNIRRNLRLIFGQQ